MDMCAYGWTQRNVGISQARVLFKLCLYNISEILIDFVLKKERESNQFAIPQINVFVIVYGLKVAVAKRWFSLAKSPTTTIIAMMLVAARDRQKAKLLFDDRKF